MPEKVRNGYGTAAGAGGFRIMRNPQDCHGAPRLAEIIRNSYSVTFSGFGCGNVFADTLLPRSAAKMPHDVKPDFIPVGREEAGNWRIQGSGSRTAR